MAGQLANFDAASSIQVALEHAKATAGLTFSAIKIVHERLGRGGKADALLGLGAHVLVDDQAAIVCEAQKTGVLTLAVSGRHLKGFISELGGREAGNFWFKESGLLLSTYVDDLTLAGPSHLHKDFWEKLTRVVDIEPPEDIYRVLGRNHLLIDAPKDPTEPDLNAAMGRLKGGMAFDMRDYARQTVALYLEVAQLKTEKLRDATTPFCPAGSLDPADDALEGELGFAACRKRGKPYGWVVWHARTWSSALATLLPLFRNGLGTAISSYIGLSAT